MRTSYGKSSNGMPRLALLLVWVFFQAGLSAQNISQTGEAPCSEYNRLISEAEEAVEKREYGLAIRKYNAAKVCNPGEGLMITEEILNVFDSIDNQRLVALRNARRAQEAEREARQQASIARQQERIAREAQELAEASADTARAQEARARRFLSEIYVHEAERAAADKAWDKALLNYHYAYQVDSTREDALNLSFETTDSVLPELLTIHRLKRIWDVRFSPDGRYLVSITGDNIQFFGLNNFKDAFTIRSIWPVDRLIFSPGQDSLVAALSLYYGRVVFWTINEKTELPQLRRNLGWNQVGNIRFDPGANLFMYSFRGNLVFGNFDNSEVLSWINPEKDTLGIQFDYFPEKQLVAAAYPENKTNSIKIIDISEIHDKKVKFVSGFGSEVEEVHFSPDGEQIGAILRDNTVRIFNLAAEQETEVIRETEGEVRFFTFFNEGNNFVYAVNNYRDSANIESRMVIYRRNGDRFEKQSENWMGNNLVRALSVHPDGTFIAAALSNATIKLWPLSFKPSLPDRESLDAFIRYGLSFSIDSSGGYLMREDSLRAWDLGHAANEQRISWLPEGGKFLLPLYYENLERVVDKRDLNDLAIATVAQNKARIDSLLSLGVSALAVNELGANALSYAAFYGFEEEFNLLAKELTKPEMEKEFLYATIDRYHQIVRYYLQHQVVDVNCRQANQETALFLAAQFNDTLTMQVLLEYGADPHLKNSQGYSPLLVALLGNNRAAARLLLPYVDKIDLVDSLGGYTELMIAIRNDYEKIAQTLIQKGADVNARNKEQWTPIHLAAYNGNAEMMDLLLANGAKLDLVNDIQQSPLHLAIQNGNMKTVEKLLDLGVAIDRPDKNGYTPLMYAAAQGKIKLVKLLLDRGSDPKAEDKHGNTVVLQAKANDYPEIYDLLIEYGGVDRKLFIRDSLELTGHGNNITANKTADVSLVIFRQDTVYRAVGQFDDVNLFGKFDIEGLEIHCTGDELCLQFTGWILNGYGADNFPKGTSTRFVISLYISEKEATGTYHIGEILNSPMQYEQYGILELEVVNGRKAFTKR